MMLFVWITVLGLLQSVCQLDINFLGLFAIFAGFKKGPIWGLAAGIFIGVFAEVLSSSVSGLNLMLYSGLGLLAGIVRQRIYYREGPAMELVFSFLGIMLFYVAYFAFTRTVQPGAIVTIIFSSVVSPLLFRLVE